MATLWVSSAPRGAANGTSYADAWGSMSDYWTYANASGVKGDIVNVVNDGDHTLPASATQVTTAHTGTEFDSDPGIVIRGTDSSGAAAMTTFISAGSSFFFISIANGARYVTIDGFVFDQTAVPDTNGTKLAQYNGTTSGPIRMRNCHFIGWADNDATTHDAVRRIWDYTATAPDFWGEVASCWLQNMSSPFEPGGTAPETWSVNNCLITTIGKFTDVFASTAQITATPHASHSHGFFNNTWYIDTDDTALVLISSAVASGAYGTVQFHSNVFWINNDAVGGTHVTTVWGTTGASTATWFGNANYNIYYGGPDTAEANWAAHYSPPWITSGAGGPEPNDVAVYETADTVLFFDPASTFDWEMSGHGYTLTVDKDLRIILHTTAGRNNSLPGALPAGTTDRAVTIEPDREFPDAGSVVTYTITATNTGADDTNVAVTATIPVGTTLIGATPTQGTYNEITGIWTIGAMAAGASETLTIILIMPETGDTTVVFSVSITGDVTDPTPGNDTDSVSVTTQIDDPISGPSSIPLIDTLPIYAPVMKFDYNMVYRAKKNRTTMRVIRKDVENQSWREMTTRRIVLSTNTTTTVNMGGIQQGQFLLVESDIAVQVGVGRGTAKLFPASTGVALVVSDFEILQIKNPSTTDEASILMVVSD